MQIRNNTTCLRAFTLLELIVAMALMDVIAVALYSSMYIAFKSKTKGDESIRPFQSVTPVFEYMRTDLCSAMRPDGILAGTFTGESNSGQEDLNEDTLSFYTCSYRPGEDDIASNIVNIAYGLDTDARQQQVVLKRYVKTNLLAPSTSDPQEEVLCRDIQGLEFQYYDGSAWLDEWDSSVESSQLPWAVQVTLTIENEEDPQANRRLSSSTSENRFRHFTRIFILPTAHQQETEESSDQQGGGML